MGKKICMLVTNPVTSDPRVRREAATLVRAGYQVTVIGVSGDGGQEAACIDGYQVLCIPPPELRTFSLRSLILAWLKRLTPGLYDFLKERYRTMRLGQQETGGPTWKLNTTEMGSSRAPTFSTKLAADRQQIEFTVKLNLALARAAVVQQADIYHAHDLDTLLAGYLAKRRTGKKLVYDFHELYTEQFKHGVKTALWTRCYSMLERFLVKRVDLKLTVCDSLGTWASQRYGVNGVITVMNVPHSTDSRPIQPRERREKIILYQGHYFRDRGLEQLIDSARYLDHGRIVLRGGGYLEDHLRNLVREKGVQDKVVFAPPVPVTELVRTAAEADIGAAPFLPVCLNTWFCLPNKLFEYMMAGLAIVGSDLPELRRIIVGHNLGGLFNPEDSKDLARAINELINDEAKLQRMKHNSYQAARDLYNWEREEKKLLRAYDCATVGWN